MKSRTPLLEGDHFITVSGRLTGPYPKANYSSEKRNITAVQEWLKAEALAEAGATRNDHCATLFSGLDPKNWSMSDSDSVNLFLFDDPDGDIGHRKVSLTQIQLPFPEKGEKVTAEHIKLNGSRNVLHEVARDAMLSIDPNIHYGDAASYLYVLPPQPGYNGAARFVPDGIQAPAGWKLAAGKEFKLGWMVSEAIMSTLCDVLRSAPICGELAQDVTVAAPAPPKHAHNSSPAQGGMF